jgi:type IV secretory pathway TrbD component
MNTPREVIFHQSANRPHLLLGGDREMVLFAILFAALIGFSLLTWWGLLIAAIFWTTAVAVLSRMGKSDPLLRHVYLRHIRYQSFYPAKSPRHATAELTPLHWR